MKNKIQFLVLLLLSIFLVSCGETKIEEAKKEPVVGEQNKEVSKEMDKTTNSEVEKNKEKVTESKVEENKEQVTELKAEEKTVEVKETSIKTGKEEEVKVENNEKESENKNNEISPEDQVTAEDLFKILDIGTDEIDTAEEKIKKTK